ncbi:MAG: hypothetical protein N3A65_01365 [candidate division WOR-3 bacterium]|nr:hypothetical protein [candidate division WOR-3 bacterium]
MPVQEIYFFQKINNRNSSRPNRIKPRIYIRHKKIIEQILKPEKEKNHPIVETQLDLFKNNNN